MANVPPVPDISHDKYNAEYDSDDLSVLGRAKRKIPNQNEPNSTLLEAIWHNDGTAQLYCLQQVEESMGCWVSGKEASLHYPGTELFETAARQTPALADSSGRHVEDF